MNHEELMDKFCLFSAECRDLLDKKNQDYSSGNDALYNFTLSNDEKISIIGMYTRLSDKLSRLRSFILTGNLKCESLHDTLVDISNYAFLTEMVIRGVSKVEVKEEVKEEITSKTQHKVLVNKG